VGMRPTTYEGLAEPYRRLLDRAALAMEKAYAPYTGFCVGAAVLTREGELFAGANVETASYVGVCAEAAALAAAVEQGHYEIMALAVISRSRFYDVTRVAGPCGACRQLINEFAQVTGADIDVICAGTRKDPIVVAKLSALLPLSFGPVDTETDVSRYRR